jgi:lipoprotein NlpI
MFKSMLKFALCFIAAASIFAAQPAAPPPYESALIQGTEAEQKGLLGRALGFYQDAQKIDPKRVDAYFYSGRVLARQGKHEEAIAAFSKVVEIEPKASTAYKLRGLEQFRMAQVEKSLEDFDRYIALEPQQAPYLWQRGISLYYARRYEDGRKQFELHQTVNSSDVENAVWDFMCVARAENFEKARAALIPIAEDRRVPMMEIYKLFAGKGSVEDVQKAVDAGNPTPVQMDSRKFYMELYLGLYFEAKGDAKLAYEHIKRAATGGSADYMDYMGDVAKVHFQRLLKNPPK